MALSHEILISHRAVMLFGTIPVFFFFCNATPHQCGSCLDKVHKTPPKQSNIYSRSSNLNKEAKKVRGEPELTRTWTCIPSSSSTRSGKGKTSLGWPRLGALPTSISAGAFSLGTHLLAVPTLPP